MNINKLAQARAKALVYRRLVNDLLDTGTSVEDASSLARNHPDNRWAATRFMEDTVGISKENMAICATFVVGILLMVAVVMPWLFENVVAPVAEHTAKAASVITVKAMDKAVDIKIALDSLESLKKER